MVTRPIKKIWVRKGHSLAVSDVNHARLFHWNNRACRWIFSRQQLRVCSSQNVIHQEQAPLGSTALLNLSKGTTWCLSNLSTWTGNVHQSRAQIAMNILLRLSTKSRQPACYRMPLLIIKICILGKEFWRWMQLSNWTRLHRKNYPCWTKIRLISSAQYRKRKCSQRCRSNLIRLPSSKWAWFRKSRHYLSLRVSQSSIIITWRPSCKGNRHWRTYWFRAGRMRSNCRAWLLMPTLQKSLSCRGHATLMRYKTRSYLKLSRALISSAIWGRTN